MDFFFAQVNIHAISHEIRPYLQLESILKLNAQLSFALNQNHICRIFKTTLFMYNTTKPQGKTDFRFLER